MNFIEYVTTYEPVSLEQAKLLKSLGYKKPCYFYYVDTDVPYVPRGMRNSERRMNHNRYDNFVYSAPDKNDKAVIKLLK